MNDGSREYGWKQQYYLYVKIYNKKLECETAKYNKFVDKTNSLYVYKQPMLININRENLCLLVIVKRREHINKREFKLLINCKSLHSSGPDQPDIIWYLQSVKITLPKHFYCSFARNLDAFSLVDSQ